MSSDEEKANPHSGLIGVFVEVSMACLVGGEGCRLTGQVVMVWLGVVVKGSLSQGVWPSSAIGWGWFW